MSGFKGLSKDFKEYTLERFKDDLYEADKYCQYLISEIIEVDDIESLGVVYFLLSYLNKELCNYEKSIKYGEKAEIILVKLTEDESLLDVYNIIAPYNYKLGRYKISLKYFYKALKITENLYEKTKDIKFYEEIVAIHMFMASIYFKLGVKNMGKFYFEEALKMDSHNIERCDIYTNLYICYYMNDKFKEAKIYAEKCFELLKKNNKVISKEEITEYLLPIIRCDIALGNLYEALNNLKYTDKIIKFNKGCLYFLYGNVYEKFNNIDLANKYYIKAYENYKKDKRYIELLITLNKIIEYYKEKNDAINELTYRRIFMEISSEINRLDDDYTMIDYASKFYAERAIIESERAITKQKKEYNKDIEKLSYKLITTVDELNNVQSQISEKEQTIKVIAERLSRDSMTGVYNKEFILEQIKKFEDEKCNFFIAMLDLDNYKEINDKYGHLFGDKVLKKIALKIQDELKEYDLLGRFGGEEFIIIYKEKKLDYILRSTERIRSSIENISWENGAKITLSIGVAKHNIKNVDGYVDTIKKADDNLYEAKRNGKNMVCI